MEKFGEEIGAEACSGKEIAGLLRDDDDDDEYDDSNIVKIADSRVANWRQVGTS